MELDELDDAPDGVFVEDAIIVFPTLDSSSSGAAGTVVLVRSGSDARRAEYESAKRAANKELVPRGYEVLDFHDQSVDPSGEATLDGGDILKVVSGGSATVFVGQSSRTNPLGIEVLDRELGKKRGWKVVSIPVEHHLHLSQSDGFLNGTVHSSPAHLLFVLLSSHSFRICNNGPSRRKVPHRPRRAAIRRIYPPRSPSS